MKASGIVILALVLLCSCSAPNDNIIVPGKRVGNIVIGHTKDSEVGPGDGSISAEYNNEGLGFGFNLHRRVTSIDVSRSNFRTREGLAVGSTEQQVVAAYGPGEIVNVPIMDGEKQKGLLSNHARHYRGIRWLIAPDHRVWMIMVDSE
jgi:hypothetical protein